MIEPRLRNAAQELFVGLASFLAIAGGLYLRKPVETGQMMGTTGMLMGLFWVVWVLGLIGLMIAAFCRLQGRYVGASVGIGFPLCLCFWNLATYADYGELIVSPTQEDYVQATAQLLVVAALIGFSEHITRRIPPRFVAKIRWLGRGAIGLWLTAVLGAAVLILR